MWVHLYGLQMIKIFQLCDVCVCEQSSFYIKFFLLKNLRSGSQEEYIFQCLCNRHIILEAVSLKSSGIKNRSEAFLCVCPWTHVSPTYNCSSVIIFSVHRGNSQLLNNLSLSAMHTLALSYTIHTYGEQEGRSQETK